MILNSLYVEFAILVRKTDEKFGQIGKSHSSFVFRIQALNIHGINLHGAKKPKLQLFVFKRKKYSSCLVSNTPV